jgi:hypothetical protein
MGGAFQARIHKQSCTRRCTYEELHGGLRKQSYMERAAHLLVELLLVAPPGRRGLGEECVERGPEARVHVQAQFRLAPHRDPPVVPEVVQQRRKVHLRWDL